MFALILYRKQLKKDRKNNGKLPPELVRARHGGVLRTIDGYGLLALGIPLPIKGRTGKPIRLGGNFALREVPLVGASGAVVINIFVYVFVTLWMSSPLYVTWDAAWQPVQAWALR
jgi:hypothetical protein